MKAEFIVAGGVVAAVVALILYLRGNPPGNKGENYAYGTVSDVVNSLSGGKYLSLGGAFFGETPAELDINKPVTQADIDAYRRGRGAQAAVPVQGDPLSDIAPYLI